MIEYRGYFLKKIHDVSFDMINYFLDKNRDFKFFYVKGTNGSGKSTIPRMMVEKDPSSFWIFDKDKKKKLATVSPNFKCASVGPYTPGKTSGGGDYLIKVKMQEALEILYELSCDIYFEGIMPSDTLWTWYDYLMAKKDKREVIILFLDTPFEECLNRIQKRTGKTQAMVDALKHVKLKYDRIIKYKVDYKYNLKGRQTAVLKELSTRGTQEEVFQRFLRGEFKDV